MMNGLCEVRSSSVGIATPYGLDGPGIESRWEARFSAPVQTGPGAHLASCTVVAWLFPGKWSGSGFDYPPPASAEVEERVQLCTCTSRLCLRDILQGETDISHLHFTLERSANVHKIIWPMVFQRKKFRPFG